MNKPSRSALGVLIGAIGLIVIFTASAHSQRPAAEETLAQRIAKAAKLPEENATRFFTALGPVIREDLRRGKEVSIAGLGTFRIVRIAEHRDLRDGRPVIIPAVNTIEFLPEGGVMESANSEGAQPAETVPPFQYILIPGQTPGQKAPKTRVPPIRTK